jgi:hypothetical protein
MKTARLDDHFVIRSVFKFPSRCSITCIQNLGMRLEFCWQRFCLCLQHSTTTEFKFQHTSAYAKSAYISIRQHSSACVSKRRHTSQHTSKRTSAYVSMLQHTSLILHHDIAKFEFQILFFFLLHWFVCVCVCVCVLCVCVYLCVFACVCACACVLIRNDSSGNT